jgi:hypothetical protein
MKNIIEKLQAVRISINMINVFISDMFMPPPPD